MAKGACVLVVMLDGSTVHDKDITLYSQSKCLNILGGKISYVAKNDAQKDSSFLSFRVVFREEAKVHWSWWPQG